MRVNGYAAPIIGYGQVTARLKFHFNTAGMTGDGLVHGIIDNFGKKVMQSTGVRPANIHTGAQTNGFEAL